MLRSHRILPLCCLLATLGLTLLARADAGAETSFRPIFDGKTLEGWSAPDMRYWSVTDGAITAKSSKELPCRQNQFLVWQGGIIDDFDLKLKFRISGQPGANSGIQVRSQIAEDGHAIGYQADIDRAGQWRGALYDEHTGRAVLAKPGQRTVIDEKGARKTEALGSPKPTFDSEGWNDYRITARGTRLTLSVNGKVTADVTDGQTGQRDLWGRLAVQIHSGPPMTVQFKDIKLKRLPLSDGRKKIVVIAGAPSHASGEHEFNAGVKLLSKRLQKIESIVAAPYHDRGWPKDPTAFDNANAIIVYADGGGRHPLVKNLNEVDELMARGVGLMCMHYGVEVVPGKPGDFFKKWIGGFYEHAFSSNPHWNAELKTGEHPISNGVREAKIHDEWYFSIRFREDMKGVTSVLKAAPDKKARSRNGYPPRPYPHIIANEGKVETLMWATERADGGRGVGFTGGHWHRNWAFDAQRRAVLNGMLWVAGAKVPEKGVESDPVSVEELNADLDKKRKMKRVELPEGVR